MNLEDLAKNFSTEESAISYLESKLWPNGPGCPKCGLVGHAFRMESKAKTKNKMRPGLWKCSGCRKTFRVTVNTIFEDSHIPLHKWMMAIHLMSASKKGISARQLHRMLGIGYRAAWFMAHRIRFAMTSNDTTPLSGIVEADETYIGPKTRGPGVYEGKRRKTPVLSLVERNGKARSFHVANVTAKNLGPILKEHISEQANLMTDDFSTYASLGKNFASHDVINHKQQKYSRHEGDKVITANTVEGYFSIPKRGVYGTFHHVSKQPLGRYLSEFDFRYNARKIEDGERAILAVQGAMGKRLTYRDSSRESFSK